MAIRKALATFSNFVYLFKGAISYTATDHAR